MKKKFTKDEDMLIVALVNELGLHHWKEISEQLKNRTPRQCRERWTHYLAPDVATSPWTPEDDRILEEKFNELGGKWTKIKEFLPNKTAVNIKNRYSLLKRKKSKQQTESIQHNIPNEQAYIKPTLPNYYIPPINHTPPNYQIIYLYPQPPPPNLIPQNRTD